MTKIEIKEFKKLVKWAKKNGIAKFDPTTGAFELHPPVIKEKKSLEPKQEETDPALLRNDPEAQMPSDDEMLFWSTDAFDILRADRKDETPR